MATGLAALVTDAVITDTTTPSLGKFNRYDASGGALTVSLPALSGLNVGARMACQKYDASGNPVTFVCAGADTFDDTTTTTLALTSLNDQREIQVVQISTTKFWKIVGTVGVSGAAGLMANVFGATGNGSTDDTAAIQAAIDAAAATGEPVFFPKGTYLISSSLTVANDTMLIGSGNGSTLLFTTPNATLFDIDSLQAVRMTDLNLVLGTAATGSTLVTLTDTFMCAFLRVRFAGQHTDRTVSTYRTQTGVSLQPNSGDNHFIGCIFGSLGVGIRTDVIMNWFTSCNVVNCYRSLVGGDPTGTLPAAGIAMSNCSFVGAYPTADGTTDTHILVEGSSNDWWFDNIWIESCQTAVSVGSGTYAPESFSMSRCHIAATDKCIDLIAARQAYLADIMFSDDSLHHACTPTELSINATNAASGTAINLKSTQDFEIAASVFPAGWAYMSRGGENSLAPGGLATPKVSTDEVYTESGDHSFAVRAAAGTNAFLELWGSNGGSPSINAAGTASDIGAVVSPKGGGYITIYEPAGQYSVNFSADGAENDVYLNFHTKGGGRVQENGNTVVSAVGVPANAGATGKPGQIAYDSTHIYVCIATDTWIRGDAATW